MTREKFLKKFVGDGPSPFVVGHHEGVSGNHVETYFLKDALYQRPSVASAIAHWIASLFPVTNPDVVVAPATGGCILGNRVAEWLTHLGDPGRKEVLSVYADKSPQGGFVIKRGYGEVVSGKRVLVVEDKVTTAGSVNSVIEAVRLAGGMVVDVGVICIHNKAVLPKISFQSLQWLVCLDEPVYDPPCPLCLQGIPLSKELGHG